MSELFEDKIDEDAQRLDELIDVRDDSVADARRRWEQLMEDKRLREDLDDFFEESR